MRQLAVAVVLLLVACGDDGGGTGTCDDTLLPGDLVITEVFADFAGAAGSSGTDEGNEWFEIHNTSSRPLSLGGLSVVHSREDGSMSHDATLDAVTVPAGGYVVLGNILDDLKPAWVDVGYASALGDLYNTGTGKLALRCGTTEIDSATYADVASGESRQLDGGSPPDYTANDDPANWCAAPHDATSTFTPSNYGTPGAANTDCEIIVPGMCDDGTSLRPVQPPALGDLVITEIMPNPAAVGDALGEWFEVKVNRDVDLNGLGLDRAGDSAAADVVTGERCLRATAGSLLVFARSTDAGVNGGLPKVDGTFKFSMVSGAAAAPGDLQLVVGTTVIDAFAWTSSRSGKALQVDPDFANATDNDAQPNWCDATQPYGEGDLGTPGEPNAQCGSAAPPGSCLDGTTSRLVVFPDTGDLVITEVMPSPNAVSDTTGEWFEVLATRDVDLNGLGLDRASDASNPNVLSSASCLRLAAGQRAVFARSSDTAANGGLPAVTGAFTFSMVTGSTTTPGDVQLLLGVDVLDAVTWTHSTSGASLALDPDFANNLDNDVDANWCDGAAAYGAGDLGTPGAANAQCTGGPAPGTCLDNGVARAAVLPIAGDLVITEVMPNPAAVSDTTGEWFEILAVNGFDLNGVGLDRAGDTANPNVINSSACIHVDAGTYAVFAKNPDPALNGGLPSNAVLGGFTFSLVDGTALAPGDVRVMTGTTVIDAITWTSTRSGKSHALDPDSLDAAANDLQANFCDGAVAFGAGDLGTPGAANPQCVTSTAGMCTDGGVPRAIVKPVVGQLEISEYLANPANVTGFTDAQREWFEVTNTGTTAFDLNELELARAGGTGQAITSATCKVVAPGGYALFARSADPAVNAMLPTVDATFTFGLVDTTGDVEVRDGTTILDAVTWASVTSGRSAQVFGAVCLATATYGDASNAGTPRAANVCP